MEMRDPVSAQTSAEETTPTPAPTPVETDETKDEQIEKVGELDAEQAAEEEMTDGVAEEEASRLTAEAVIDLARELLAKDAAEISTDDIRRLRQQFNLVHKVSEPEAGAAEAEQTEDAVAEEFKELLAKLREKKAEHAARIEAEQLANLERKRAIIDEIIALAGDTDNVNRTFPRYRELQDEFNSIGDVPPTEDTGIWKRFQEARERYSDNLKINKELRDYDFKKNLDSKNLLLAEALKESTDWKAATDEFVAMQKEWKTIGAVAKKHSDAVWQRFLAACDYFFDRKKKAGSGTRKAESDNLRAKRDVIAALGEITAEMPREDAIAKMRELQERWKEIGHVPFREKDKVYEAFRAKLDELRSMLNMRESRARMERFTESIGQMEGDDQKLYRERERLMRTLEGRRQELRTYENNMGFLSSRSKSGESMVREFERKAERLKEDISGLEDQIRLIDSKLK